MLASFTRSICEGAPEATKMAVGAAGTKAPSRAGFVCFGSEAG
ncbi:Hypothetical protein A7982_02302 [Minicystis rosea]|nr:Hypothetical protein A7982_02302 [Minicystis rosea]